MDQVKAWANRIGLVAIIAGFVAVTLAGGDPAEGVSLGGVVAAAVGGAILIAKEIWQSVRG